jgi:hypothetical protein
MAPATPRRARLEQMPRRPPVYRGDPFPLRPYRCTQPCLQLHPHQPHSLATVLLWRARHFSVVGASVVSMQDVPPLFVSSIAAKIGSRTYLGHKACAVLWGASTAAGVPGAAPGATSIGCREARLARQRTTYHSPCRGAAPCGLRLVAGGGGWCCCCGAATHAARSVEACNRGPPSSASASTSGLSRPVLPRRL